MGLWTSSRPSSRPVIGDIEELRARLNVLFQGFGSPPEGVHFKPAQFGPIKGEWVSADEGAVPKMADRAILYFHGGAFIAGSPQTHRPLVAKLVLASACPAFCAAYRLAPESVFPAAVRDGIDAYRGLLAKSIPPGGIVLAGDGSGGGLAFAVCLAIRNAGLPLPAGIAAMSPWADLSLSGWSMLQNQKSDPALNWELLFQCARHYLRKTNPSDPYASPVFANFKNFPPIMVHAGSLEILRDDASKLGDRASDAATPVSIEIYDGMNHLFQGDGRAPEARISLARLGQFIRGRTGDRRMPEPAATGKSPGG